MDVAHRDAFDEDDYRLPAIWVVAGATGEREERLLRALPVIPSTSHRLGARSGSSVMHAIMDVSPRFQYCSRWHRRAPWGRLGEHEDLGLEYCSCSKRVEVCRGTAALDAP